MRHGVLVFAVLLLATCGGPTVADLSVAVRPVGDPARPDALLVTNTSGRSWDTVRIVLEQAEIDGSTASCGEQNLASWAVDEEVRLASCGERTRVTFETEGVTAVYVWAGGTLSRRIGRKEIPVVQ